VELPYEHAGFDALDSGEPEDPGSDSSEQEVFDRAHRLELTAERLEECVLLLSALKRQNRSRGCHAVA